MKLTLTNIAIVATGLLAAALINWVASSYFSSSYDHLAAAQNAARVAQADLDLSSQVKVNLAKLRAQAHTVPMWERVGATVSEIRSTAAHSGLRVTTLTANGTPNFTLEGPLSSILLFLDTMKTWTEPMKVQSITISGKQSALVAQVYAAY